MISLSEESKKNKKNPKQMDKQKTKTRVIDTEKNRQLPEGRVVGGGDEVMAAFMNTVSPLELEGGLFLTQRHRHQVLPSLEKVF